MLRAVRYLLFPKDIKLSLLLFSLIDKRTFRSAGAALRLQESGLLTADAMDKADEATIKSLIYPVCFLGDH